MDQDLSSLSKAEIVSQMDLISTQTSEAYNKIASAKNEDDRKAAQISYEALTAKYDQLKAEYDKRVAM